MISYTSPVKKLTLSAFLCATLISCGASAVRAETPPLDPALAKTLRMAVLDGSDADRAAVEKLLKGDAVNKLADAIVTYRLAKLEERRRVAWAAYQETCKQDPSKNWCGYRLGEDLGDGTNYVFRRPQSEINRISEAFREESWATTFYVKSEGGKLKSQRLDAPYDHADRGGLE